MQVAPSSKDCICQAIRANEEHGEKYSRLSSPQLCNQSRGFWQLHHRVSSHEFLPRQRLCHVQDLLEHAKLVVFLISTFFRITIPILNLGALYIAQYPATVAAIGMLYLAEQVLSFRDQVAEAVERVLNPGAELAIRFEQSAAAKAMEDFVRDVCGWSPCSHRAMILP